MVATPQKSSSKAAETKATETKVADKKTTEVKAEKPVDQTQAQQAQVKPDSDPTAPQVFEVLDIRMSLLREGYKQDDVTNARIESVAGTLGLQKPFTTDQAQSVRRAIRAQLGEPQGQAAQQPQQPQAQAAQSSFAVPDHSQDNAAAITTVQQNLAGAIAASDQTFIELGQNLGRRQLSLMLNAQLETLVAGSQVLAQVITGFNQQVVTVVNQADKKLTASDFKFLPDLPQHALPHTLGNESSVEGDVYQRWS
ncbi:MULTISPECIES: hypothetical protein [Trichocoleus]|uniref:Uncharacterized protein n=1 Tax=Trichocoleus desertorum GB2-A4 TaxID=2933944 RepID=A0ABV0JCV9_9CYAN|nr:hypothetical protein [Trichocoleus sp. FACHB-46]MBD1864271.1 hypothetical protein [Trichocoleus sp. FACHB-46]